MEAVRPASATDGTACRRLLAEALAAARRQRGGLALAGDASVGSSALDADALARAWLSPSEDRLVLVGTFSEEIVGLAAGQVGPGPAPVGEILCCYVEPEAREVGVGRALLDGLVAWFGTRHCTEVDAVALPGDRHSKQLYEAGGFTTRLLVLRRTAG
jgi:ribosomal protein S18 acetylase RimI-like enzyme